MAESYRNWPEYQSAKALHDEFAATKHGEKLRNASRYDLYRNKNDGGMSHKEWARLLGRDVNNLLHMEYTLDLAAHLERKRHIPNTPHARSRKLKAASSHDNGEAIKGDILYIHKKPSDFVKERKAFLKHIPEFYASEDTQAEMKELAETIIFDDSTPEGRELNMVEQLGYLQTCLKAWSAVNYGKAKDLSEDDKAAILGITASVLGSTLDKTLEYYDSNTHPEFNHFINNRRKLMIEAFDTMPPEAFTVFGELRQERADSFLKAKQEWTLRFDNYETTRREAA